MNAVEQTCTMTTEAVDHITKQVDSKPTVGIIVGIGLGTLVESLIEDRE